MLHSAPVAPVRGVLLSYSLRCLGCSSPWDLVHPQTIQYEGLCRASFRPGCSSPGRPFFFFLRCLGCSSPWHLVRSRTILSGGFGRASFRPGCSSPGRLFVVFSPLPRTFQSVAPGSPPDDPVPGLVPCLIPPRLLQSGASFYRILSVASDAPVRGTWFTPGRSSPGACAVLHSAPVAPVRGVPFFSFSVAPDAPVRGTWFTPGRSSPGASAVLHSAPVAPPRGVFLSYSLRCLGSSSPWHLVHPRTIQSGGLCRASFRPGCSSPGRHFFVFTRLPRTLQSVAPGSPPDDPVRGLGPSSTPPLVLQSGLSFVLLSLLAFACVVLWCFFFIFSRALRRCSSPAPLRSAVLGTLSRAAVRRVLCALPGFAAPDGRQGLAPVHVPWLWPAVCLPGVPRGPALVRRSSSGPVALGAPVGFPVAVVPSPDPGAVAPGFTG